MGDRQVNRSGYALSTVAQMVLPAEVDTRVGVVIAFPGRSVSIKIMTLVWEMAIGDHTDKLLLLALADNANDEGECYPSLSRLTEKCEISRRTAIYSLQRLEAAGLITRKISPGRNTVYEIHLTRANGAPVQTVHPCTDDTGANGAPTGANGAPLPPPYKPPPSENRHKPSGRHKPSRVRQTPIPDAPPPSNLNVEAWHRWEQYRKQIRKPIHPASTLAAQRKLAAFGPDQSAVVEQCIANGYQGLYGSKDGPQQPREGRVARFRTA